MKGIVQAMLAQIDFNSLAWQAVVGLVVVVSALVAHIAKNKRQSNSKHISLEEVRDEISDELRWREYGQQIRELNRRVDRLEQSEHDE